ELAAVPRRHCGIVRRAKRHRCRIAQVRSPDLQRRSVMRQTLLVCGCVFLLVTVAHAQTKPATSGVGTQTLRTPWGDPDLQGVWNVAAGTPLERPSALADKEFLTDEELAQAEKEIHARSNADRHDDAGTLADLRREHNDFWFDKRKTILTKRI